MSLLQSLSSFVVNVGQTISAADLTVLRDNVALIDQLTYRITPCFDSSAGIDTGTPGYGKTDGDPYGTSWRVWRGAFRFRAGMTTLTVTGFAQRSTKGGSNEVLKVYVNNSGTASATITPAAATFATSFGISFTDGQVVPVEIKLEGTVHGADSKMVIYAVYGSPIDYTVTSYPGVPSFASTYSATLLNQLVSAYTWLYNRIAAVPIVPGLAQNYALGPYFVATWPLYYGAVQRSYSNDVLYVRMIVTNPTSPGLRYLIYLNGSLVATGPTWGPGTYDVAVSFSLSAISVGARAEVIIYADLTSAPAASLYKFTRWTILAVRAQADYLAGSSYPYASLTSVPLGDVTISDATLNTFLNNLATTLTAAKARIDAAPHVFARGYAMRQYYAARGGTIDNGALSHRARPRFIRLTDRLFVAGKEVKIMYGPVSVKVDETAYAFYDDHTFARTENVIDADKDETTIAYLDTFDGLFPGTAYQVGGSELLYCEEIF